MYRFLVLSVVLLSVICTLNASDTTKVSKGYNFFRIAVDFKSYQFLDQQTSALSYKGTLPGLHLAYEVDRSKRKYGFDLVANYGPVTGETKYTNYIANQGLFSLGGYYLHSLPLKPLNIDIYSGLSINHTACLHYNQNLQNASLNLSVLNHLAIDVKLEKEFSWKAKTVKLWFLKFKRRDRRLKANLDIKIPIYFQNYRSPYATISDFSDGENLWSLEKSSYFMFSKAILLETNMGLTYYLNNGNALRFAYQWQAFRFKDQFFTYQAAYHGFSFSLLMKLN